MEQHYTIEDFLYVHSAGGGSFSPDGSHIAYLSNETGTWQVFLIPTVGGDSEQLTHFQDPVSFVRFSPTENICIFGKAENGSEQTQLFLFDLKTRKSTQITTAPNMQHRFGGWSPDGKYICFASNERNGVDFDVYTLEIATKKKICVFTMGGRCFAEGFSPRGTYLVVRKVHAHANTDQYLCNLATGIITNLTPHDGDVVHEGSFWLPDESGFFRLENTDREFVGLAQYSIRERCSRYVLTPDWDVEDVAVDKHGKKIAVGINNNGSREVTLYAIGTYDTPACTLSDNALYQIQFSQDGSHIAYNKGGARHALDLWVLNIVNETQCQLTHSNQGVPAKIMIEPEMIHTTSFDGRSIPAYLYKPKRRKSEKQLPVVMFIHGGPDEQFRPLYHPILQYLVYSGYAVVAPNIRGSAGYGKTYMTLDNKEKRMDSVKDIVAVRDYIANDSDLDEDTIALYGISYGGFMVLASMAFYPKLWAAGISIAGISNFVTYMEHTAPYRRMLREAEYGSLEHDKKLLEALSPIHSIQNIQAPLLLIHGANDPRVPLAEAEQVLKVLRSEKKEVDLLVYDDEGHGLAKRKNKLDAYPKMITFLNKAIGLSDRL